MAKRLLGLVLCASSALSACAKKDAAPHRTEPWLAHPSASASGGLSSNAPRTFHFAASSYVSFSVPGRKNKVSGRVPVSQGTLELDPRDLKSARASVDADLTRLSIDGPLPEGLELGGTPSEIALNWLELGRDVPAERRAGFATARFELASVEDLSLGFIDLAAQRKRTKVRATAAGTLLIHGFRAPVRAGVWLEALAAEPGAPERLSIRSAGPLVVPLAPHDISARGPSGVADALGAARAADWVGKSARIEFELMAEAEPRPFK